MLTLPLASIVMYQRARSLGNWDRYDADTLFMLIEQQQEAYALAINSLCLLDAGDAWISLSANDDEFGPSERRSANAGGFELEEGVGDGGGDMEIVELSDMRRKFELCKARRELAIRYAASGSKVSEAGENSVYYVYGFH
jgi:nuclear pore complex protein Nup160